MQIPVLLISLGLMALVAYGFIASIKSTDTPSQGDPNNHRGKLIWAMIIFGAIITPLSIWQWPHSVSASADTVTINASGAQWYWEIDTEEVQLGKTVVFNVHTEDVTHGLGVLGPDGRLLFQTQAMPGYVNTVEYTFHEPGEYRVICMEFCGVAHHDMITEFNVVKAQDN